MRAFLILGFVVAAASAASLGFDYGTAGSAGSVNYVKSGSGYVAPATTFVSGGGLVGKSLSGSTGYVSGNSGFGGGAAVQPSTSYVSGVNTLGAGFQNNIQSRSSLLGSSILSTADNSFQNAGTTFVTLDELNSVPQTVEYNKQIYYFAAPEEERSQGIVNKQLSNILKKNLQVVFIKAPENNAATNAAIQLAKQAIEQRTAIYVLSKESDANQVVGQLQQIQENVQVAPEVAIIKYRTAEDLANAQASIQAQYDNFGGAVPLINGGIVPILNYASPASTANIINISGASNAFGSDLNIVKGSSGGSSGAAVISTGYLPPFALKKK